MNIRRTLFWSGFVVVLVLIVWGLIASMGRQASTPVFGTPVPVSSADHVRGPSGAPVTVIEYSDFQCPACEAYYLLMEQLLSGASTTMRLVYRHFPLPQHPNAALAAQASEAAGMQGKFWEMYGLLFQDHAEWTDVPDPHQAFDGYALRLGLNVGKFKSDMDSAAAKGIVDGQLAEGQSIGIDYTPTFFVNGKVINNPQSYEQFKAIIDAAAR
jgi:protein-disulfide isomerase